MWWGLFDPMYFVIVGPALILSIIAQVSVKSAFARHAKVGTASGLTGAEAAASILRGYGLGNVRIERARGFLSDHYDPRARVLRLSSDVYQGRSLSSVGVACHEAGHALQHAQGCANPILLRVETRAGHGASKPTWMRIEDYADQWAFAAKHLGMEVPE